MLLVSSLVPFSTKLCCFRVFQGRALVRIFCGVFHKENRNYPFVGMKVSCSTCTTATHELDYLQSQGIGRNKHIIADIMHAVCWV